MSTRVLVVDDEPCIVSGLRIFMEDEGMHVACAGSGEEAVDMLLMDPGIDVCIVDIRLPGMNGDNTIRAMHEINPGLKFIIHTGSTDYSIPDDLRAIGIDERQLFAKPLLDMTPLVDSIAVLTGSRG